jgi:hypothetical protein
MPNHAASATLTISFNIFPSPMKAKVYGIRNCDTMKKAFVWGALLQQNPSPAEFGAAL